MGPNVTSALLHFSPSSALLRPRAFYGRPLFEQAMAEGELGSALHRAVAQRHLPFLAKRQDGEGEGCRRRAAPVGRTRGSKRCAIPSKSTANILFRRSSRTRRAVSAASTSIRDCCANASS